MTTNRAIDQLRGHLAPPIVGESHPLPDRPEIYHAPLRSAWPFHLKAPDMGNPGINEPVAQENE